MSTRDGTRGDIFGFGGGSGGGGCVITGPLPIYEQDDGSLATAAHIIDLAGNCIKNLAGDILIQRGVPYTP
jgi:hypothetical protein